MTYKEKGNITTCSFLVIFLPQTHAAIMVEFFIRIRYRHVLLEYLCFLFHKYSIKTYFFSFLFLVKMQIDTTDIEGLSDKHPAILRSGGANSMKVGSLSYEMLTRMRRQDPPFVFLSQRSVCMRVCLHKYV